MSVDFGKTAGDYGKHRHGFPESLFGRLTLYGVGLPGQQVVDVGTGTGTLARGFARRGCQVVGVDPAEPMLVEARRLAQAEGIADAALELRVATAEHTEVPDGWADTLTAGQCWHWFDRPAAAAEARRVLKPGGHIAICHFDWLPLPGSVVEATEQLIVEHNRAWGLAGGMGMYPPWTVDLAAAGFGAMETFSYDVDAEYSHEAWRGRIRASAGIAASLPPPEVERFDAALKTLLEARFPADPLACPHRVWALVARAPEA